MSKSQRRANDGWCRLAARIVRYPQCRHALIRKLAGVSLGGGGSVALGVVAAAAVTSDGKRGGGGVINGW